MKKINYTVSKKFPPKDTRCDTKTVDSDHKGFGVRLKGCPNPATVELLGGVMGEVWVCSSCAVSLMKRK